VWHVVWFFEFAHLLLSVGFETEAAGTIVRSIDETTSSIMHKLANPLRAEFSYKGLVVGYVQSGKTANYTALISKAVDAGYKFIIVLSGIHSILRRQTQIRLDKELTGMNDLRIDDAFIEEPSDIKRWNRITTARLRQVRTEGGEIKVQDLGEFETINVDPFDSICNRSTPTLAIIKKNVAVLYRLITYMRQSSESNRSNIPLLVIDDEADQASINTNANDPDSDPTRTNEAIRRLLELFPRKAYIGYTATPFANVLIDMTTEHQLLEDDLYPRNFIVSLPKPDGYFGTSILFQGDLAQRFIKEIPDEANTFIRYGNMTENLSIAIDQFILCCAVRNLRGDSEKPMSMLVHVSHRISNMSTINTIVSNYIENVTGRYNNRIHSRGLKEHYRDIWQNIIPDSEAISTSLDITTNVIPDFDQIWEEISNVFGVLRIVELNSASDDVLDYTTGEEIKVIAIGGNQLSRGLTLEGLMTNYYLRASKRYDTLLQMGRWFGYRKGYEDLTRIHTTQQISEFFEHLALVEDELRSEIYRYEEEEKTPIEMAIAIRDYRYLNITARNKMGAARLRQSSCSDSLNQTIWLPLNQPDVLRDNYNLGASFIQNINNDIGFTNVDNSGVYLANRKLDGEIVLREFLNRYIFVDRESTGGPGLDADNLLSYIFRRLNDQNPELTQWSVAVAGNSKRTATDDPANFGGLGINKIQRSRKYTIQGFNIGVLTEPDHLSIDLGPNETRSPQNPLLLLYLIWKDSSSATQIENPLPDQRINLYRYVDSERVDVLGIAIKLPRSQYEPNDYIGQ
ncbi:Z1 domain-containing protein, partial [candidate division KSB1 bacterium]|nr:Z1 domain-containing protein [candidate division KSB1 bacterium]